MSAGAISYQVQLDNGPFVRGMQGVQASLGQLTSALAPLAALTAGFVGLAGAGAALGKSIGQAAEMETLETSFVTLLGSVSAAKQRMQELNQFAASTPFDLPGVVRASRTLETLTSGALSTGDGLRLVGDVASGTGVPFDEMATTVGRLYDALQSGRPAGEAMARLQELGAISGSTRAKIEALQQSGAAGDSVWSVAAEALGRYSGEMQRQSGTWNGLLSTLRESIDMVFAAFGAPLIDSLKPALQGMIDLVGKLQPLAQSLGEKLGGALTQLAAAGASLGKGLIQAIKVGEIGNLLKLAVSGVGKALISSLGTAASTFVQVLGAGLRGAFQSALALFSDASFWGGIMSMVESIALTLKSALLDTAAEVVAAMPKALGGGEENAAPLRTEALATGYESAAMESTARGQFKNVDFDKVMAPIAAAGVQASTTVANALKKVFATFANMPELVELRKKMAQLAAQFDAENAKTTAAPTPKPSAPAPAKPAAPTEAPGIIKQLGQATRAAVDSYTKMGAFVGGTAGSSPAAREAARTNEHLRAFQRAVGAGIAQVVEATKAQGTAAWA